ncbi:type II toxin-antitoxin system HicB family antitoxin [Bradyrhizobium jicamae]|uniref:type II toxin-antitoxin system HicB family antitoxin n=1 Tax=Bradyrhizobium jicamae TaxID=280332 RepID=UPI001BACF816|nr:type II toxin-antitoxin system HicB family antitoxin [Bradyrhizobium jicamae]MBR0939387.1 type II toxin-antitoxin system HicB family antitoxin [Bradyrhizobium jicamae]
MSRPIEYPVTIRRLPPADSGFVTLVADVPVRMSDGETLQEAFANVEDAIVCWIKAANEMGRPLRMSDGETLQEAFVNVEDAIVCWIKAANEMGRPVPEPTPGLDQGENRTQLADAIAARQLHVLGQYQQARDGKLRLSDIKVMFSKMPT